MLVIVKVLPSDNTHSQISSLTIIMLVIHWRVHVQGLLVIVRWCLELQASEGLNKVGGPLKWGFLGWLANWCWLMARRLSSSPCVLLHRNTWVSLWSSSLRWIIQNSKAEATKTVFVTVLAMYCHSNRSRRELNNGMNISGQAHWKTLETSYYSPPPSPVVSYVFHMQRMLVLCWETIPHESHISPCLVSRECLLFHILFSKMVV